MSEKKAKTSNWSQDKRIEFIDFRLHWTGKINRSDLIEFFGISVPQASLDLARYIDWRPDNVFYDKKTKAYLRSEEFQPLFSEKGSRYYLRNLLALNQNIIKSDESFIGNPPPCDVLPYFDRTVPEETLALILEAINSKKAIRVSYLSMTRDIASERTLNPHAIVFDGHRWHVRAYCQTRKDFRDFVLARIISAKLIDEVIVSSEQDCAWNTFITLVFKPSSDLADAHRKAVEYDYGMTEGKIEIKCRKALLFYTLKRYNLLKDFITDSRKLEKLNDQFITLSNHEEIYPFIIDEIGQ
ncbi:WYL domain-containing protein [Acinetobacter bereziniae]|uniref:WYL domain-containing protein n=1 Tax=Acinetobacter bereziniae TaxID=106648 RepID=UPI0032127578